MIKISVILCKSIVMFVFSVGGRVVFSYCEDDSGLFILNFKFSLSRSEFLENEIKHSLMNLAMFAL